MRRPRISRCSGLWTRSTRERPPSSPSSSGRAPVRAWAASRRAFQHGCRVDVGGAEEGLDLALEVVAQPGHAGELGAVGLFVEADPEAEVVGVDGELPLDVDDVRCDEEESAGPSGPVGSSPVAGAKVSYWPRTREARKDSSMPSSTPVTLPPTAPATAPPGCAGAAFGHFVEEGYEEFPEAGDVGADPAGAVDDEDGGVGGFVAVGDHAGESADVFLGRLGVAPQLRDDLAGLVAADLGSWAYEAGRGRDGEIPVDHPVRSGTTDARHASTVRARRRIGEGARAGGVRLVGFYARGAGAVRAVARASRAGWAVWGRGCRRRGTRRPGGGRRRWRRGRRGC